LFRHILRLFGFPVFQRHQGVSPQVWAWSERAQLQRRGERRDQWTRATPQRVRRRGARPVTQRATATARWADGPE